MVIACLGWGSLIWKPGDLPVTGDWFTDGPMFPIEFSRPSDGGELATVICMNAPPCRVLWARLDVHSIGEACEALRKREQIVTERQDAIGVLVVGESPTGELAEWASARQLDAVIWTALPPRLGEREGQVPSIEDAIVYLASLAGETREHALDYFKQVPEQIDTPYRREITKRLGW